MARRKSSKSGGGFGIVLVIVAIFVAVSYFSSSKDTARTGAVSAPTVAATFTATPTATAKAALSRPKAASTPAVTPEVEIDYVLNKSTKKFHKVGCPAVKSIKSKNRSEYTGTRDDLIARGYSPCGQCNP